MGIDGSEIRKYTDKIEHEQAIRENQRKAMLMTCPACESTVSKNAIDCPKCGEPLKNRHDFFAGSNVPIDKMIGGAGALIMAAGVFAPLISAPIVGSMNYFKNGEGDGIFILAMAAVTITCIIIKRMKFLYGTGIFSLAMIGYTFYEMKSRMNEMEAEMNADLAGNPFRGIADLAVSSINMQWGWAALCAGALLIITAAFISTEE